MKFVLVPIKSTTNLEKNITLIEEAAGKYKNKDLLLFGEGFLQGFGNLSFDYEKDLLKACGLFSVEVMKLRKVARDHNVALGFGFYENDKGGIYNSYLILGNNGQTLLKHQALTDNWQEKAACADYRQGHSLGSFSLEKKQFSLLLNDDIYKDDSLLGLCELDDRVDGFIWISGNEDVTAKSRSALLAKPVYYLAGGEAYVLERGRAVRKNANGGPLEVEFVG
ncbi:MAG: hypothetical protein GX046_02000 [Tissierellia bacterium]|nr:hypothetical protein [Tissierellia bacterium]